MLPLYLRALIPLITAVDVQFCSLIYSKPLGTLSPLSRPTLGLYTELCYTQQSPLSLCALSSLSLPRLQPSSSSLLPPPILASPTALFLPPSSCYLLLLVIFLLWFLHHIPITSVRSSEGSQRPEQQQSHRHSRPSHPRQKGVQPACLPVPVLRELQNAVWHGSAGELARGDGGNPQPGWGRAMAGSVTAHHHPASS